MRIRKFGALLTTSLAAALVTLTFSTAPLSAQEAAVIKGKVTSETGEPLGGANVTVAGTNQGVVTTANGTFTLTIGGAAVKGQQVVLVARYIGHKPVNRTVTLTAGEQEQNFQLAADPLRLEEVVVTGVGEATDRRKLPNVVASVSAEQLQAVPGQSALQAVEGKVAGVRLIPNSAQPGGEPSLRLRGATSIGGRQDPLYIVDGVITRFGLADIAGEDVERVELVKGAAASAMYGSDAANGVVQVFTKRGNSLPDGGVRVTTRVEGGFNNMPSRMQFSHHHAWEVNSSLGYCTSLDPAYTVDPVGNYCLDGGARVINYAQISNNPYTVYHDHWNALVRNGQYWTGYASVGQRQGNTNFNASFEETRNKGVIFGLGGYNRQNFRLNLDQQVRSNLDASFSAFYGTSTNGRAAEASGGPFFGLMFLQPDVDITACCNPDGSRYIAKVPLSGDVANDFNPLYELANRKIDQDRNRFSGSGRMRWRINSWLQGEGTFAYDQEAQSFSDLQPFGYLTSSGSKTAGSLIQQSRNDWQANGGVTLTSVRRLGSSITNTTKVAAIFENQRNRLLQSNAGAFVVSRVPEFGAGTDPSSVTSNSFDERIRNENFYAVTTFDIKDRYILDGLVRRDGSSLFGPENRWATYYRASAAWRVTQDIHVPGVDEMRLRASYGTAGLRPSFSDQYEILAVSPAGFSTDILGNPLLKPARSGELEVGTNIDFGGSRYTLEYTYARKTTRDQILLVDLSVAARSPSGTGGFKRQWQNTGTLRSWTHELTFAARLVNKPGTQLTLNIVGDRTRQMITNWTLPERLYGFEQMPRAFFLGPNSDLGVLYGNHWVRNIDELYADPAKAALSAPGQTWSRDSVMVNEDGYVVRKNLYGTPRERAIKYTYCRRTDPTTGSCLETSETVKIGDANPDFNLSFGLNFNFKRFAVNALLDWSYGGQLYNGTRQWAFQATRDRVQDQFGKPANAAACGALPGGNLPNGTTQPTDPMPSCPQKAIAYYGVGFYNGLDPNDYFIESGSYAKLKELAVHYTLSGNALHAIGLRSLNELRVGVIARNLFTITKYSGLDPEVSGLFGDPFQVRMDWFQYPQFRTLTAVVEITY
jgi:TonB-linked SusC/RagA family outer membrane protein